MGENFLVELEYAKRAILISPFTYRVVFKNKVRVFIIQRFPYSLYYIINGSNIDVISVSNTNQNPKKWKEKLG
ncbi:hypothetical protein GCM10026987_11300 [Belliella aquatica]|uniref:Plasmid stabilization system protein n=1 Tax=Belliella aquatica TaxID=1323734 RepID=A0ABQ1M2J5_9BACT|nr:hypothetical protein GCM10010993_10620 [Belliella aquatica]